VNYVILKTKYCNVFWIKNHLIWLKIIVILIIKEKRGIEETKKGG